MPKKRKEIKKKIMPKKIFVLSILLILVLIVLTSSITTKHLYLYCFKSGSSIECQWANCQLKTEENELVLAKTPDYVETVAITEETGSAVFSPSPLAGTYTTLLSCKNGEIIQRINIS